MGIYFNPGRTPLPVTLGSGAALSVPAKGTVTIAPEDESSESVQRAVAKGHLRRQNGPQVAAPEEPPAVEPPIRFPGEPIEVPTVPPPAAPSSPEPVEAPADDDADHVVRPEEGSGLTPPGSRRSSSSRRPT
jgi:hypothetical protein